jgi:butyrate kinase
VGSLLERCFQSGADKKQVLGAWWERAGGLVGYLNTNDARKVEK